MNRLVTPSASMVKSANSDGAPKRRLKILMLRVRLLHPRHSGGVIRTANLLQELSREHDVTLVAYRYPENGEEDVQRTAELCHRLVTVPFQETPKGTPRFYLELLKSLLSPLPYSVSKYAGTEFADAVARVYREESPDLILCDFLHACVGLRRLEGAPFLLFQHNVEAVITEQLSAHAGSLPARLYLGLQARRLFNYEKRQCRAARHIIAVSEEDRAAYKTRYGADRCDTIPTGVDIDYFTPTDAPAQPGRMVFTGSMDWLANQDAIHFFADEILPRIRASIPEASFTVVGRNPPPAVVELGKRPGIVVTGTVPDIRPYVQEGDLYVVPLRIGSGTRMKLLEAMAMGKPILSTRLGAEGLPVEHDHNIVFADGPEAFADAAVALLKDPARRARLGDCARQTAVERHAWPQVGRIFNDLCANTALSLKESRIP